MQYMCHYMSPLGPLTLVSDGEALTGVWFDGQKYFASTMNEPVEEAELPVFIQSREWLDIYFQGKDPGKVPLVRMTGSAFRLAVWAELCRIPYGQVVTYAGIARRILCRFGVSRMSAQAVGGAVGHNPVSIFVPCHRVVGSNGSLTGYAGGLDVKEKLLILEKADWHRPLVLE